MSNKIVLGMMVEISLQRRRVAHGSKQSFKHVDSKIGRAVHIFIVYLPCSWDTGLVQLFFGMNRVIS